MGLPTPEEELASVSDEEINLLMQRFQERVTVNNPDFYSEDLERAKVDRFWLRRFIAHCEFNMDTAVNMLYDTCQWRKEFRANELDQTSVPWEMIEKGVLFIRNKDKWGKKLLIFKSKLHQKGVDNFDDVKKRLVYYFDRIERESKSDQISVIFDMKDCGWSNMDMDFIRYMITLLKQYYPFFVNYLIIYEMPWLLKSAWNIIKGWLPPKFVDRVKFIDKKGIGEYIDPDNQLADWGGNDLYVFKFEPEVRSKTPATRKKSSKINVPVPSINLTNGTDTESVEVEVRKRTPPLVKARAPTPKPESLALEKNGRAEREIEDSGTISTPMSRTPTPSPSPVHRPLSKMQEMDSMDNDGHDDRSQLVKVDIVVKFEKEQGTNDINGHFTIESVGNKETVIYKVKTTDPSKFRVRPTIGVLEKEAKVTVNIGVVDGVSLHQIARERFQVQAMVLPLEYNGSVVGSGDHSNYPQINDLWKKIANSDVSKQPETHRMTCRLDPSIFPSDIGDGSEVVNPSSKATINREDTRRALDTLEQKITTSFNNNLNEKFDYIIKLIYGLFVLVIVLTFFLWISIPSSSTISHYVIKGIEENAAAAKSRLTEEMAADSAGA